MCRREGRDSKEILREVQTMLQDKYVSTINGEPVTVRRHYDPVARVQNSEFVFIHFDSDGSEVIVYTTTGGISPGINPKWGQTRAGLAIKQFLADVASRASYAAWQEQLPPEQTAKEDKLKHYAERPLTKFLQLDGFYLGVDGGDSIMVPDKDGDDCWFSATEELMHGADVRILVKDGVSPDTAIRLIQKLSKDIAGAMNTVRGGESRVEND